jgi:hypothetical protein
MTRSSSSLTRFTSAAAVAVLALATQGFAATRDAMSLIPANATSVGMVRLSDARNSPISRMLFTQTDKVSTDGDAARFLRDAGLQPSKDIDIVVIASAPQSSLSDETSVLVAAEGRFDVERLSSAIVSRGATKTPTASGAYYLLPEKESSSNRGAVAFISPTLAVAGTERAVAQALIDNAAGGTNFSAASGLAREMSRIDPHATAWALVDVARAARMKGGPHVPAQHNGSDQVIASALRSVSTVALSAIDTGDSLRLTATGVSQDDDTRQLLEDTLRGMLSAWRLAVQDKSPQLVSVLRKFTVTNSANAVTISGTLSADNLKSLKFSE